MKKLLSLMLCVLTALTVLCVPVSAEGPAASMTVYGLNLSVAGDSSLLYSNGKWLLIDAGDESTSDELVSKLQKYGITDLDVYISHMHPDHFGGVAAVGANFRIGTLYLPDQNIANETPHPYQTVVSTSSARDDVRYLNVGDTFSVGAAEAKVLGPVGSYSINEMDKDAYTNNYSLTTKFTCGEFSYLTCGDIEAQEENALLEVYKNGELKADIFKLSHHGYVTSNQPAFLAAVAPKASYGLNLGEGTNFVKTETGTYRRTYTQRLNASRYGLTCMVGDEGVDFSVKAENGKLTFYRDEKLLTGMVELSGGDGVYRKTDKYYIDKNGTVLTGIQKIDGKLYNFSTGGCMERGRYNKDGAYFERVTSSNGGIRAYSKDGVMLTGLQKVYNENVPNWYNYFDKTTGLLVTGKSEGDLVKIDGKTYSINEKGTVRVNGWKESGGKYRFFDNNGVMKTGWMKYNGYTYYLDPQSGVRSTGMRKIGSYYYSFSDYGTMYKNGWKTFGKKYRYFDQDGKMKTGWQTISGKKYYFDLKSGYRLTGLQKIGSKYYWFSDYGTMYKNGWKAFGKKYRYFDKNGVMKTGWQKINGKNYYFSKTTGYRATGLYKIGSSTYGFSQYGVRFNAGFKKYSKKYRYFDKNGKMAVGWKTIKSKKYYFDKNSYRVTGKKKIGKKTYRFSSSGVLQK